jgi:hypothetical protein
MNNLLTSPWDDLTHPIILIVEDSDEDFYMFMSLHSAGYLRQKIIFTRRSTEKLQN